MLLEVKSLSKNFGALTAVSNISLAIDHHELIGLIGPNGAGKTTFFNLLTGVYRPTSGQITFYPEGKPIDIQGKKPNIINQKGMARTFQNIRLFKDQTVLDNIKVAMNHKQGASVWDSLWRTQRYYQQEDLVEEQALKLLAIFDLDQHAMLPARNLAYGQQRKLEIARALATQPKLLFLDEPAAGMNPKETEELMSLIDTIRQRFALTIVLIEHDMSLVMKLCERIYVLEYGQLIAQGSPQEIKENPRVIQAYLGGDA
ncbi:ABC transporter ATP-binding protein [Ignavigranum ruoffiae]|uniref:ABC transporter ATP-binding protein n=1 Tax=Ignavigranum ruoffiae TaxID=89093 RepID=UPI00235397CC|nr:ABC transporter ATP-binding protein [Ignavigranum ruoffiae]